MGVNRSATEWRCHLAHGEPAVGRRGGTKHLSPGGATSGRSATEWRCHLAHGESAVGRRGGTKHLSPGGATSGHREGREPTGSALTPPPRGWVICGLTGVPRLRRGLQDATRFAGFQRWGRAVISRSLPTGGAPTLPDSTGWRNERTTYANYVPIYVSP